MIVGITQRAYFHAPYNELWECVDSVLYEFVANLGFMGVGISFTNNIECVLRLCDSIILSGGNDIGKCERRDKFEKALLDSAIRQNKKVLGICRGAQIIATHFGITLQKSAHKIKDFYALQGTLNHKVRCFHKYCIKNNEILKQNNFEILATSATSANCSEIEAFTKENILAFMWHPEREKNSVDSAIIGTFLKGEK
ncbi:gamma-glutamyl-gamma-aminobutyrate hydrolase family protein [Helicobacter sp. 23-1045]